MKKSEQIWPLVFIGLVIVIAMTAFYSRGIFGAVPTSIYHDHLQDQRGNALSNYWIGFTTCADTTKYVAVDTANGVDGYKMTLPSGCYRIYVAKCGGIDTTYEKTVIHTVDLTGTVYLGDAAGDTTRIRTLRVKNKATFDDSIWANTFIGNISADDVNVRHDLKKWSPSAYGAIPFCLSAHDGYAVHYTWADTARKYGVPVTFMIPPGALGTMNHMTEAQVESLNVWGHEVAGHGWIDENYLTLWNAGRKDSCYALMKMVKDSLEDIIHNSDSFYVCQSWVFPGNSYNDALASKAASLFSNNQGGTSPTYQATLESWDAYKWFLPVNAGDLFDSSPDTSEYYPKLDSLLALWVNGCWADKNHSIEKFYGEHSIGGFYMHDSDYVASSPYENFSLKDFGELCHYLKEKENKGLIWLTTHSELSEYIRSHNGSFDGRFWTLPNSCTFIQYVQDSTRQNQDEEQVIFQGYNYYMHAYETWEGCYAALLARNRAGSTGAGMVIRNMSNTGIGLNCYADNSAWRAIYMGTGKAELGATAADSTIVRTLKVYGDAKVKGTMKGLADSATVWLGAGAKADTSDRKLYRMPICFSQQSITSTQKHGSTNKPGYSVPDTAVICGATMSCYLSAADAIWQMSVKRSDNDSTICMMEAKSGAAAEFISTRADPATFGCSPVFKYNANLDPIIGFYVEWKEISGTATLTSGTVVVEIYLANP